MKALRLVREASCRSISRRRGWHASPLAATVAALLLTVAAAEAVIPADALLERLKPNGFVNDFAGTLTPSQRDALAQRVRQLQQQTGAELAVVTVKSLEGGQIDDFCHKLFRRWGVGQKGKNNGVMLLVALEDRKMRIEVGYGLEPILPDGLAARIIDEDLRPLFRESRYADGMSRAVDRIAGIVERGEPPSRLEAAKSRIFASPTDAPIPAQIAAALFLPIFVLFGAAFTGSGLGSKTVLPIFAGLLFGGIPTFMALMIGGLALWVVAPVWIVMLPLGIWDARKNPGKYRKGCPSDGSWAMGPSSDGDSGWGGGGFSGGDSGGGGFGGGDSGGGGASGSW